MTERIRWERVDGTVTSWFGYVGSHKGPLFQILHPVVSKPDTRTQFHKWALAATFAQDEVRYPETAEGAQSALKDEAEEWLAGFVSSLGAIFPAEREEFEFPRDGLDLEVAFDLGAYVRYQHPDAGWEDDQDDARKLLTHGRLYRVAWNEIGQSKTRIGLVGIKGVGFNSVLFEPVASEDVTDAEAAEVNRRETTAAMAGEETDQ